MGFWALFSCLGYHTSAVLTIAGVVLIAVHRIIWRFAHLDLLISFILLTLIIYAVIQYSRGDDKAVFNFAITLVGIMFIGWIGAYMISLSQVQDGRWWMLLILPTTWLVDSGAYTFGNLWGRHPLDKRLSPKKTWEGIIGGLVFGVIFGILIGMLWHLFAPQITWQLGAWLGLVMGLVTPLGDLAKSLFKRTADVKDFSNLIPGHGGMMDRIDTWIWAAMIGYYLVNILTK